MRVLFYILFSVLTARAGFTTNWVLATGTAFHSGLTNACADMFYLIPNMTSEVNPSGQVTYKGNWFDQYSAWYAFTGITNLCSQGYSGSAVVTVTSLGDYPVWIQYQFGGGATPLAKAWSYCFPASFWYSGTPVTLTLYGSLNGSDWTVLDQLTLNQNYDCGDNWYFYRTFPNTTRYGYYRFEWTTGYYYMNASFSGVQLYGCQ